MTLRETFARNIRLLRLHQGMSQEMLADEAQLDRAFVGTLERGERNISTDNVEKLCAAVGAPANELLDPEFSLLQERVGTLVCGVRKGLRGRLVEHVPREEHEVALGPTFVSSDLFVL